MTTLSHERAGVARFHLVLRSKLDALLAEPAARAALRDRRHRQQIAQLWSQIACMRWTTERSLAQLRLGAASGTAGSLARQVRSGRTSMPGLRRPATAAADGSTTSSA